MMNLIDRYVYDVGRRLPRKQRADVETELRSTIQDTLEDRVQGKPSDDDVVALLKEFGSPEEVAASYRPSSRYLIGPELYPFFKLVMGAVLLALTIALLVANVAGILFTPVESIDIVNRLLNGLGGYFQALLSGFASVVIVFAILQRLEVKPDEDESEWDPQALPDVKDFDRVGRGESIVGIVFTIVFLVLLNALGDRTSLVFASGQVTLPTGLLGELLPWLNAALLLGLALNVVLLWIGHWQLFTRLFKTGIDLLWIYIIYQAVNILAANESLLAEAGLPDPLPSMLVRLGYGILALVTILFVFNTAKWIYHSLRRPAPEPAINV